MKKAKYILIIIAASFACIILGFFIGRICKDGTMTIHTEKSVQSISKNLNDPRPNGIVNINTANAELLQELPGIGEQTARDIVKYRRQNGPFSCKEDIMNVPGIGKGVYEQIQSMICV